MNLALVRIVTATPDPGGASPSATTSPSAVPGLSENAISPGFLGFLATFVLAGAVVLLVLSMTRHMRKVTHQAGEDNIVAANLRTAQEQAQRDSRTDDVPVLMRERPKRRNRGGDAAAAPRDGEGS